MKEKVLISSSQVVLLQDGRRRSVGFQIADDNKALVWCISNSLVLNFFYAAATCIVSIVESGRLVETEENDQSRRVREYW